MVDSQVDLLWWKCAFRAQGAGLGVSGSSLHQVVLFCSLKSLMLMGRMTMAMHCSLALELKVGIPPLSSEPSQKNNQSLFLFSQFSSEPFVYSACV